MNDKITSLGKMFFIIREELNQSKEALAAKAEVSTRIILKLENDEYVAAKSREKIVRALNEFRREAGLDPLRLERQEGRWILRSRGPTWLKFPQRDWLRKIHGPAAMLTAEFRVVQFHGVQSQRELEDLTTWSFGPSQLGIRVYKGEGGVGKTRLAVELCHRLASLPPDIKGRKNEWTAGFLQLENFQLSASPWDALPEISQPVLVVVDYAGEPRKAPALIHLLRHLTKCPAPKLRLLLLERTDEWLDRLHRDSAAREILSGELLASTPKRALSAPSVAVSSTERNNSWRIAADAFRNKMGVKLRPALETDLSPKFYSHVLFIHIQALLAFSGNQTDSRKAILKHLLDREINYWEQRLPSFGLSLALLPAIEEAVARISERDGAPDKETAAEILKKIDLLSDQQKVIHDQILRLLHECYPLGQTGIGPLQPDELKFHLLTKYA